MSAVPDALERSNNKPLAETHTKPAVSVVTVIDFSYQGDRVGDNIKATMAALAELPCFWLSACSDSPTSTGLPVAHFPEGLFSDSHLAPMSLGLVTAHKVCWTLTL